MTKLKKHGRLLLILATVIAVAFAVFGITNPELFTGEVLLYSNESQIPTGEGEIFIPNNYQATVGQSGEIEIITTKAITSVNAFSFDLEFNKQQIEAVEIITEDTPLANFIKTLNNDKPLGSSIALAAAQPVSVSANTALVKIKMRLADDVDEDTEITLTPDSAVLVDGDLQSTSLAVGAGQITVISGDSSSSAPVLRSVTPSEISSNSAQTLTITMDNLLPPVQVYAGTTALKVNSATGSTIKAVLPENFDEGAYDLIVINDDGKNTQLEQALIVSYEHQISFEDSAFTTTPDRVKNDGEDEITLWVKVADPLGVSDIDGVFADLTKLGGNPSVEFTAGKIVEEQRWYSLIITVPSTVATSENPYDIPVLARNKSGFIAEAEIEVLVSNQSGSSASPQVLEVTTSPDGTVAQGKQVDFYAYIKDSDGTNDIQEVLINLVPLGGQPTVMTATTATTSSTEQSDFKYAQWYKLDNFLISSNVSDGTYDLNITVTDRSGLTGEGEISLKVSDSASGGPEIIETATQPTKNIVAGEKINIFAKVKDEDGEADISDVVINLIELGGGPMAMSPISFGSNTAVTTGVAETESVIDTAETEQDSSIQNTLFVNSTEYSQEITGSTGNTTGTSNNTTKWFALLNFTVATDTQEGGYDVPVTVTDQSGQTDEEEIEIEIVSAADDTSAAPQVVTSRSYTTPLVALNNETTPVSLYVFVEHKTTLKNVVLNLGNIGYISDVSESFSQSSDENSSCPANSNIIVCMDKTVQEGSLGTWYKIDNVVIRKDVAANIEPYYVSVIATDTEGRVGQGDIGVTISSSADGASGTYAVDSQPPRVQLAVATAEDEVEVLFTKALDPDSVSRSGNDFVITEYNDISQKIKIKKARLNAMSTIVTLETADMEEDVIYAITVTSDITDLAGQEISAGSYNKARFIGFVENSTPPNVRTVTATSENSVEIVFTNPLKPSSMDLTFDSNQAVTVAPSQPQGHLYYSGENFIIRDRVTNNDLGIKAVRFGSDGHIIQLETDTQQSKREYFLTITDIASYGGVVAKKGILNRYFTGYTSTVKGSDTLRRSADLDGNGSVDFSDFTIFATFYGKDAGGEVESAENVQELTTQAVPTTTSAVTETPSTNNSTSDSGSTPAATVSPSTLPADSVSQTTTTSANSTANTSEDLPFLTQ